MPTIPIPNLPPDLPSGGQVTTQGDLITVNGIEQNRTIDCNNCSVDVNGVRNTIIVTGHCVKLNVNGIENTVTVDSADTITASGFDNRVTYHVGSPQVNNSGGSNNIVEQG